MFNHQKDDSIVQLLLSFDDKYVVKEIFNYQLILFNRIFFEYNSIFNNFAI
jgi:hypothetical protein